MTRNVYESPVTKCLQVELEGCLCSASADIQNPNRSDTGRIDPHDINTGFEANDFSENSWYEGEF